MAVQDEVAAVRHALTSLQHAVDRLAAGCAEGPALRRLRTDVRRVAEDLDELGDLRPGQQMGDRLPRLMFVPDQPYDPSLWSGADDEGLSGMR